MNEMAPISLSRRDALKAGGALILGFSLGGSLTTSALAKRGQTAGPPDDKQIDTWLAIHADNTATLYIGFVELGQGASTALPQVAAEELDFDLDQIRIVQQDTNVTPNQGGTYSSSAVFRGAPQVRAAAAEARQALLKLAGKRLNAPVEMLTVASGVVSVIGKPNRNVTYGKLIGGKLFELPVTGTAPVKDPASYKLVAQPLARKDLPAKVAGTYAHIQHVTLPGMLHGRIVRPQGQRAYGAGAKLLSVDESSVASVAGARVLRKGDFLGVVAPNEWDAVRAAQMLAATWDETPSLPGGGASLYAAMRAETTSDTIIAEQGDIIAGFAGATHKVSFKATTPYQAHAPFAPNCALADVKADSALVICTSQDIYNARRGLAQLLGLAEEAVRVRFTDAAGTYGHSCYDDAAQAAALMSQLAGAPVRVQFMRWDEHGWDTYGPAHAGEVRIAADRDGRLVAYEYDGWQHNWSLVEVSTQLATGAPAREWPLFMSQQVNPLVCGGQYKIPNLKLVNHQVPGGKYLRGAWLRSPLDLAFAFTSEQAIDALAHKLGIDPYIFRQRNIADERWLGVLDAAAQAASWPARPPLSAGPVYGTVAGRGIGLGTHLQSWGGAVADIEVNKETGKVRVKHLYGAIDCGLAVNPGNVEAQIVGQLVQTASRMLFEEVTFDEVGVTSLDWVSYPVIRFEDCPEVTPIVVQRLNERAQGAGEEVMAAAAAAIANAFFDATGKRMAQFPFTPERVLMTLRSA